MRQPQMSTGMPEPKLPSVGPLAAFKLLTCHGRCDCRNLNARRPVGRADTGGIRVGFLALASATAASSGCSGCYSGASPGPGARAAVTVRPRARRWVRRGPAPCHRRPRGRGLACADSSGGGANAKHGCMFKLAPCSLVPAAPRTLAARGPRSSGLVEAELPRARQLLP